MLGQRRVFSAVLVLVFAFVLGHGVLLPGPLAPRKPAPTPAPSGPRRSGDDGGFSIALTTPREPYLRGRHTVAVTAKMPAGDGIEQVDFFVDGKLVLIDLNAPYVCEVDFGDEIRRHTVVVSALTRQGRRAKVSYTSRSADLADTAARPLEVVPVLVRDARKRPVDNLSVSDFVLLEDGVRQPIVHFDTQPGPLSVAVAVHEQDPDSGTRSALRRGAAAVGAELPSYHALALLNDAQEAALDFSFDREVFARRLTRLAPDGSEPRGGSLGEALAAGLQGLRGRRGGRVLLLLASAGPPAEADDRPQEAGLEEAIEGLKRAQVMIYAVLVGTGGDEEPWSALRQAVEATGGESLAVESIDQVEAACRTIGSDLAHRYLLSYLPEHPERPGWRSLEITVRRPDLEVLARKGYSAN